MRDHNVAFADFTISCPEAAEVNSPVNAIRARGNLPLVLEHDLVIELQRSELLENWRETCALGRANLNKLVHETAARIFDALEEDEIADVPALATDTAAFFLLALRQKGVKFPCNLASCEVSYLDHQVSIN
jgi:hypothetical protein